MINQKTWIKVNQNLVAKAIGELTFEQVLTPVLKGEKYHLTLASGVEYAFHGWMSVWDYLRVDAQTVTRNNKSVTSAAQFFIDSQAETKMDDIVLGNFLEEMHNTLFADQIILEKNKDLSVQDIAGWDGEKLQTILNGHPKILLNKGRIGWNSEDLKNYSPESTESFQLHWLAVKNTLLEAPLSHELLHDSMEISQKEKLLSQLTAPKEYSILPVHPWQWQRFIQIQFAGLLSSGEMISLGVAGDFYRPQISLRTLSNATRPEKLDIKLPLTILNTSAIRGLPAKAITKGQEVSASLKQICEEDSFLKSLGTEVLLEKAGAAFIHPDYQQVKEAPYRYHEYLGAIWRESALSKTGTNEKAIISSSLFHQDENKKSLIGEMIRLSTLSPQEWLSAYFKVVVLPLYHLQLNYGVGMVSHGQNIILKMKDMKPVGMILKDFQGDLRLSTELPKLGKKYFHESGAHLTRLPPHYLIHDLITGHFITNLRFISAVMQESEGFPENVFYQILSGVIQEYVSDKEIDQRQNLLSPTLSRVLLNKVRFAIGYSDSAQRPLPILGTDLKNPLAFAGEERKL